MPKSVLTRGRKFVARLTALAMVASIMVIGAAPASAAIDTSATCPSSTASAGFTDIAAYSADTQLAINCLVAYEISQGTSATTYSPAMEVSRWQMALFLTRQAEVHGLTLGDGSDQGFTDIGAYPASTQLAINQLAQLGITTGTTATTYSPAAPVARWQMALFLTRLLDAAGYTLGSGADQGFTDISAYPASTQTAINQIAQAEVSEGFNATTFGPASSTLRSQMALFLTRTLAADGIVPAVDQRVVISPTDAATLGAGQAKAYTVTFYNTDGSLYTGRVGVQIHDVNASDAIVYNDTADNVDIESIDGVAVGGPVFTGFPGLDGKVTVVVRHDNGAAEEVRLMAYIDSDSDTTPDGVTGATTAPTEPFAVSGLLTFNVPPVEAATGSYVGLEIVSVGTGSFVASDAAVDCGNGVGAACTFFHDADDIYLIEGGASNEAAFGAALTAGDTVSVTGYNNAQPSAAHNVTFDITNDTDPTTTLVVTDPASAIEINADTYTVRGTGQVGYVVAVHVDSNMDGNWDAGEVTVGQTTVAANGTWAALVPLTQNTANHFTATMRATAGTALVADSGVDVPTITEGVPAAAVLQASEWYDSGAVDGVLDIGDVIDLNFNEALGNPVNGDEIELFDADGTRVRLTCGSNATCTIDTAKDTIRVTVTLFPELVTAGSTAGLQSPAVVDASELLGFTGADGLTVTTQDRLITEAAGPAPALP